LICPEVFAYDDDARGVVVLAEPPSSLEMGARRAVANCPEQAITVVSA
jgi:ferredoxin